MSTNVLGKTLPSRFGLTRAHSERSTSSGRRNKTLPVADTKELRMLQSASSNINSNGGALDRYRGRRELEGLGTPSEFAENIRKNARTSTLTSTQISQSGMRFPSLSSSTEQQPARMKKSSSAPSLSPTRPSRTHTSRLDPLPEANPLRSSNLGRSRTRSRPDVQEIEVPLKDLSDNETKLGEGYEQDATITNADKIWLRRLNRRKERRRSNSSPLPTPLQRAAPEPEEPGCGRIVRKRSNVQIDQNVGIRSRKGSAVADVLERHGLARNAAESENRPPETVDVFSDGSTTPASKPTPGLSLIKGFGELDIISRLQSDIQVLQMTLLQQSNAQHEEMKSLIAGLRQERESESQRLRDENARLKAENDRLWKAIDDLNGRH